MAYILRWPIPFILTRKKHLTVASVQGKSFFTWERCHNLSLLNSCDLSAILRNSGIWNKDNNSICVSFVLIEDTFCPIKFNYSCAIIPWVMLMTHVLFDMLTQGGREMLPQVKSLQCIFLSIITRQFKSWILSFLWFPNPSNMKDVFLIERERLNILFSISFDKGTYLDQLNMLLVSNI